jgi:hypothetical protein
MDDVRLIMETAVLTIVEVMMPALDAPDQETLRKWADDNLDEIRAPLNRSA